MNNVHNNTSPVLRIDLDGDEPIIRQLEDGLRQALLAGELRAGDRLPSSRALARDLGVHFNTVAQAYRTLEQEGWLALKRRAGTLVLDRPRPRPGAGERAELEQSFGDTLAALLDRYRGKGLSIERLQAVIHDKLNERGDKT